MSFQCSILQRTPNTEQPPLLALMARKQCSTELVGEKVKLFAPMIHNSAWVMHARMYKHYRLYLVKFELRSQLLLQSQCRSKRTALHTGGVQQHKAAGEATALCGSNRHDITSCLCINQQQINRKPKISII